MIEITHIGTLYDVNGDTVTALPGWHVNSTAEIQALAAYRVTPATPRVAFAGVTTWHYSFPSRQQAEELFATVDLSDPPTVRAVTMRQARLWLHGAGLLLTVEAAVSSSLDPTLRIWWDYSSEVHIDAPPLVALLPQIGLTKHELPGIFEVASKL